MCERELNGADIFSEDLNIFADKKGNKQTTYVLFQASQVRHRAPVTPKTAHLCLVLSVYQYISFLLLFLHPIPVPFNCQIPAFNSYICHTSSSFLPQNGSEPNSLALTSSFTQDRKLQSQQ